MIAVNYNWAIVLWPLVICLTIGLFFFVLKMPKDLGIYLGWLPALVFLMLTLFLDLIYLICLIIMLAIYILATALRIDKNKKLKAQEENRLKEIDKMSINDL